MTKHNEQSGFYGLGIAPQLLETIGKMGFTTPTPIQQKAIPIALEGKDIIGIAQTGTGKTLAFGVPIVQRLANAKGMALILAPTRELAFQIDEAFQPISAPFGLRTAVLIGGAPMGRQIQKLKKTPRVIIATPGRLIDHLTRRTVKLKDTNILVLDEADRMLDMGFQPQIEKVMGHLTAERQTMLFSATIPEKIVTIAERYMKMPISVEVAISGTTADDVSQELFIVKPEKKSVLLEHLLKQYRGTILIFTRTKRGAVRVNRGLKKRNYASAEIHSDLTLAKRRESLEGFKRGKYRILVATDVAARGLDVTGIELVINYDLPDEAEVYVHRIGRTARAGKAGHAISIATPDQRVQMRAIERVIRNEVPVSEHPEITTTSFNPPMVVYKTKRRRRR